jgi:hypothetical protein
MTADGCRRQQQRLLLCEVTDWGSGAAYEEPRAPKEPCIAAAAAAAAAEMAASGYDGAAWCSS